jgi:hypothetical protein
VRRATARGAAELIGAIVTLRALTACYRRVVSILARGGSPTALYLPLAGRKRRVGAPVTLRDLRPCRLRGFDRRAGTRCSRAASPNRSKADAHQAGGLDARSAPIGISADAEGVCLSRISLVGYRVERALGRGGMSVAYRRTGVPIPRRGLVQGDRGLSDQVKRVRLSRGASPPGRSPRRTSSTGVVASSASAERV